jgi:transcriptional regulator with XRE-family HTH domain
MEDFKTRLEKLMKKEGYNQSSLARKLDIKPQTVSLWLLGKAMPELPLHYKIAEILNVSPAFITYGQVYTINEEDNSQVAEEQTGYNIKTDDLIEFYKWKAEKKTEEAEKAKQTAERLKHREVGTNQ